MSDEKKEELKIPLPVSDTKVLVTGFGASEIKNILLSICATIIICIVLQSLLGNMLLTTLFAFGIPILAIFVVRKNQENENLIDQIKLMVDFSNAQKKYEYEYYDWTKKENKNIEKNKGEENGRSSE